MPNNSFDPLADQRGATAPDFDVFVWGTVFLDIIFAGLPEPPSPGTEVWAEGMASCPGGIANFAVAARRLGLRTSLAAAFGDDAYGDFCWATLAEQEGVDLSRSRRFGDWHTPVTVSVAVQHDRSMVSHGHSAPIGANELVQDPPASRSVLVDLADEEGFGPDGWVRRARQGGATVFADVGWDPEQSWSGGVLDRLKECTGFLPNAVEAMHYTRTESPQSALYALADRVPIAVVTNGGDGALAIDNLTGEEASVPALLVPELDPTGSGDVFGAAFLVGTHGGWPLADRLSFAGLAAALALQQFGGSLAAPGWGDIVDWHEALERNQATDSYHRSLRRRYGFLRELTPQVPRSAGRRASATIARRADV